MIRYVTLLTFVVLVTNDATPEVKLTYEQKREITTISADLRKNEGFNYLIQE